jgi:hypothetical protein
MTDDETMTKVKWRRKIFAAFSRLWADAAPWRSGGEYLADFSFEKAVLVLE